MIDMPQNSELIVLRNQPIVRGFYSKLVNCDGVLVRASSVVEDRALYIAAKKIDAMTSRAPQAKENLTEWRAEVHIIGRDQRVSDLPELRQYRGEVWDPTTKQTIDERTRGVGGIFASCGEENLLGLDSDKYKGGSDICIHEFAHTFMDYGLDEALRSAIEQQYNRSIGAGLWEGLYASTNAKEYWAELSMWYFGAHGERGSSGPADGREALAEYDAGGHDLLARIYTGILSPAPITVVPVRPLEAGALLGSLAGDEQATCCLLNNSDKAFAVKWIDFSGEERNYGLLWPTSQMMLKTFKAHAWKLIDTISKSETRFIVDAPCSRLVVAE